MTQIDPTPSAKTYSRRQMLGAVGKYAGAATGATIIAMSAQEALAQNASSNPCHNPNPPKRCFGK